MALISTVLAIICIFSLSVTEAQKCSNASYSLRNTKLLHNIIKTESNVNDFSTCLDKCSTHGSCHSINFNINKAICELNSANHLSNPEHVTYSYGTVYMGYSLRPVGRCSDAYCRKEDQECAMDKDGASYKCVAKQCEDILRLPGKSTTDRAFLEHAFESLPALTIELWLQIDPNGIDSLTEPTAFSYATTSVANEIVIFTMKGTGYGLILHDSPKIGIPDATVANGQWHHFCFTWESTTGQYSVYIDGVRKKQGVTPSRRPIGKGIIILGNDQDSYNGGFSLGESYQGNLTSVNIWSDIFTPQKVSVLAKSCSKLMEEGNVVTWSQFKNNTIGNVGFLCTTACV